MDNSGSITRKEWLKYLCLDPSEAGKCQFRSNFRELFNKYDKDNSGDLDKHELSEVIKDNLSYYANRF